MKTVNDLIAELQALKPSLREKQVVVTAPNGLTFEAVAKRQFDNPYDVFDKDKEPERIVITYE